MFAAPRRVVCSVLFPRHHFGITSLRSVIPCLRFISQGLTASLRDLFIPLVSSGLRHFVPLSLASRRDRSFGKSGNQRFFIACPVMSAGVNSVSHSGQAIKCRSGIPGFTDCGGKGIRTLDTLLRYTHFPGVLLRPLGHSSKNKAYLKKRISPLTHKQLSPAQKTATHRSRPIRSRFNALKLEQNFIVHNIRANFLVFAPLCNTRVRAKSRPGSAYAGNAPAAPPAAPRPAGTSAWPAPPPSSYRAR